MDTAKLATLLQETAEHHNAFEQAAPKHDWWDWYAAYLNSRMHGLNSAQATADANDYMAGLGIKLPADADSPT